MATVLHGDERLRALQHLANYPLLVDASEAAIRRIVEDATLLVADCGEQVLAPGADAAVVSFLLSGSVRIYHRLGPGREYTPKILIAPNHFGDVQLLAGAEVRPQSVDVLREATIALVPWRTMHLVLADDPRACMAWLEGLASQFLYTIDSDRHNAFTGLPGRIANVLLSYADAFGRPQSGAIEIEARLSRESIARHVGSVARSVVRVLKGLEERRIIDSHRARLVIRDANALRRWTLPGRVGLSHRLPK
jgi:CRP-like cAMP-binding protein